MIIKDPNSRDKRRKSQKRAALALKRDKTVIAIDFTGSGIMQN